MKLNRHFYIVTLAAKKPKHANASVKTSFGISSYPNLTETQAKKISKILYPDWTMESFENIYP